jgi:hypothetical protein
MTTMTSIAPRPPTTVARPLKVLVPLIKEDLRQGTEAGMDYYRRAGDKLREARPQVPAHRWTAWLTQHFAISKTTAWRYMRASELYENTDKNSDRSDVATLWELTGQRAKDRKRRRHQRGVLDAIGEVEVDHIAQERASRDEETRLHRELALQLIDIGYRALATRLHPDRAGGSRDGMRRLNRVRDELKSVAETRRFE